MEEIEKLLIDITKVRLEDLKKDKKVPSSDVLDTINTLCNIRNSF